HTRLAHATLAGPWDRWKNPDEFKRCALFHRRAEHAVAELHDRTRDALDSHDQGSRQKLPHSPTERFEVISSSTPGVGRCRTNACIGQASFATASEGAILLRATSRVPNPAKRRRREAGWRLGRDQYPTVSAPQRLKSCQGAGGRVAARSRRPCFSI